MSERGDFQSALEKRGARSGAESALEERFGPVRDHFGGIEIVLRAQAVAFGASAVRRIEAEGARLDFRHGEAAIGAGEVLEIDALGAADDGDGDEAAGKPQRGLDGLLETPGNAVLEQKAVH